jgi:hypothetical protein
MVRFFFSRRLKPWASTVIVYRPGGTAVKTNPPVTSVWVLRLSPVVSLATVTPADGIGCPVESATLPVITPVTVWPAAEESIRSDVPINAAIPYKRCNGRLSIRV